MFFEIEKVLHERLDPQREDQLTKKLEELKSEQTRQTKAQSEAVCKIVTETVDKGNLYHCFTPG